MPIKHAMRALLQIKRSFDALDICVITVIKLFQEL